MCSLGTLGICDRGDPRVCIVYAMQRQGSDEYSEWLTVLLLKAKS